MNCKSFEQLIIPYSEGSLSPDLRAQFERHLSTCKACAEKLASTVKTANVLRTYAPASAESPADLWERVEKRIASNPPARRINLRIAIPAFGLALAALVGIVFLSNSVWQPKPAMVASDRKDYSYENQGKGRAGSPPVETTKAPQQQANSEQAASDSSMPKNSSPAPDLKQNRKSLPSPQLMAKLPESPGSLEATKNPPKEQSLEKMISKLPNTSAAAPEATNETGDSMQSRGMQPMVMSMPAPDQANSIDSLKSAGDVPKTASAKMSIPKSVQGKNAGPGAGGAELQGFALAEPDIVSRIEQNIDSGDLKSAATLSDEAHESRELDQSQWFRLGQLEERIKRTNRAIEAYRKSTDGPDSSITAKANQNIKRLENQ